MTRQLVRTAGDWVLRRSPPQWIASKRASGMLAVLAYHQVDDVRSFERQLDFLLDKYTVITPDEAARAIRTRSVPDRAVLLTFDDGDTTFAENAWPAIQARGLSAVVFVVPGLVESQVPYWWDVVSEGARRGRLKGDLSGLGPAEAVAAVKQTPDAARRSLVDSLVASGRGKVVSRHMSLQTLEQLAREGVWIGNHTWTHPVLANCSAAIVQQEVAEAHKYLVSTVGTVDYFAYPNGTFDERAAAVLRQLGYQAAFLFDHRLIDPSQLDPMYVSRLRIGATDSIDRLAITLSGLHSATFHARAGWRRR